MLGKGRARLGFTRQGLTSWKVLGPLMGAEGQFPAAQELALQACFAGEGAEAQGGGPGWGRATGER